ncbi:hypothetical protein DFJ77DRAFT_112328 [Powellomyces hirtus]|nr:hypothetical protein DFJ77DRAFT_112328 [Powellomyces hirtus]
MMMSKPGDDELTLERRYLTKSGEYVWMLNKGKVVERDANGLPTRVVGANIDIGERKQTEEDLREKSIQLDENNRLLDLANKELSQALRFKSEFIANISHELRSPLNGIIGLGSVLWDTSLDEEQRELLRHVRDCSDGLLLIVNDVLDFSKIGAGKMMLEMISFDLRSCVQSAVSVTTTKAKEKNIHLSADLDPRIPPVLIGDGNRLRQVLINLVGNGVKFTSQGGVKVTVSVIDDGDLDENDPHRTGNISSAVLRSSTSDLTDVLRSSADLSSAPPSTRSVSTPADTPPATPDAEEPPVLVRFAIEDTGIGISADQFSRLFQPFSQVDASTAREFGGTGLGLAISKQLVHLMQPTSEGILVESKEGVGSTFSFTIPFRLPAAVNPHTGVSECAIESEASKKVKRITFAERMPLDILLAEDNKVNQKVALRMLLQFGYAAPKHITLANNGAEAVSLTNARAESKKPFQFILMDLQMPKLSGIEATKLIRQHHGSFANGGPAIIAMTANVMDSDKQNCYDAGMDGHIGKPFKIDALHDVLERFGKDLCARGKSNVSDNSINGSTQTNSPVSAPNSLETLHHSMSTITTATPRDSISTRTEIDGP